MPASWEAGDAGAAASYLSTSSQTHVEPPERLSSSNHKFQNKAVSTDGDGDGDCEQHDGNGRRPSQSYDLEAAAAAPWSGSPDGQTQQQASSSAHSRATRQRPRSRTNDGHGSGGGAAPPECVQDCIDGIESCTAIIVRFNERLEVSRTQAEIKREQDGDSIFVRKLLIPIVFFILSWIFAMYIWRLCAPMIRQTTAGQVLGPRGTGIGLLAAFVPLWLMTIWSYVKVVATPPGHAKDYVPTSDPPPPLTGPDHPGSTPYRPPYPDHSQQAAAPRLPALPSTASEPIDIRPSMSQSVYLSADGHEPSDAGHARPYPSVLAERDDFYAVRGASTESMRVLPGSLSADAELEAGPSMDAQAARDSAEPVATGEGAREESELPEAGVAGALGGVGAAALGASAGAQEESEQHQQAELAASPAGPPFPQQKWNGPVEPSRQPQNSPPPLSAQSLYCHRCRIVKPPRTHHCKKCNACVLKMDHHCPWVGGCVGAQNQKFFFVFVFWVTLLEVYVLVSTAFHFHRGVQSLRNGGSGWSVDGYLISVLALSAMFTLFTSALLFTHIFLTSHNLTTIEHLGVNRVKGREEVLMDRWFGYQSSLSSPSGDGSAQQKKRKRSGGLGGLHLKEKKDMKKRWNHLWGSWTTTGNIWWIGGRDELGMAVARPDEQGNGATVARQEAAVPSPQHGSDGESGADAEKQHARRMSFQKRWSPQHAERTRVKGKGAWKVNMELALGPSMWTWLLPVGRAPASGLEFPINPRFGAQGTHRQRHDWPEELR
ncbi:uncharacterized protein PFL1_00396 [Pseudozyma flocculosa PF-1]|uniref:Palmitoyltransferase n=1 Tax=Pseudozyma flocculosa TaxID=84751 RepID=A0A5C3ETL4_9BASI|nr:uncharacterized protein PFL1_00396 [Pseudozyma flocculosa PF-1]EPQ32199.1 hypothetical protein PFL1_00396 [Pseudozyma flocculosa PF-1]SPO34857.1 related to Zinc finger DHHC domain containing protein 2 [Pseudozyma flocculosa]